jgi:hypothetical protein
MGSPITWTVINVQTSVSVYCWNHSLKWSIFPESFQGYEELILTGSNMLGSKSWVNIVCSIWVYKGKSIHKRRRQKKKLFYFSIMSFMFLNRNTNIPLATWMYKSINYLVSIQSQRFFIRVVRSCQNVSVTSDICSWCSLLHQFVLCEVQL